MEFDQRRQELASRGFVVMRQHFRSGSVYCMRHADHQKGGQLYSIDLANGRWHRWGIDVDGVWHEWDDFPCVPKDTKKAHESLHLSPRDACPQTFVAECEAAGFVIEPNHTRTVDFGNRFGRFDGVRYLIC